jgi:hypothetical protein
MRWQLLLGLVLLVPAGQACSLASSPVGPGVIEITDWGGNVAHRVEVPERGLGADCSLQVPMALHGDVFVWVQEERMYRLNLTTRVRDSWAFGLDAHLLKMDKLGVLAFVQQGRYPDHQTDIYAVRADGTAGLIRSTPGYESLYDPSSSVGSHTNVTDPRTGRTIAQFNPPPHADYPGDQTILGKRDVRYGIYEVVGQGRQVSLRWDNETGEWLNLPDGWYHDSFVVDGQLVGRRDDQMHFVDLATGTTTTGPEPVLRILLASDGWFATGSYAEKYRDSPFDYLPIPAFAPGLVACALVVLAVLGRPGPKR